MDACISAMPHSTASKRRVVTRGVDITINTMCNTGMEKKPHRDWKLIAALGGPARVAQCLGWQDEAGVIQRIQNWKYRGIPELLRYQRQDVFGPAPKPEAA